MNSTCCEPGDIMLVLVDARQPAQPRVNQAGKLGERQELEVEQPSQGFTLQNKPAS